jgi:hypothetical protein
MPAIVSRPRPRLGRESRLRTASTVAARLTALLRERGLEIGDEQLAEARVGLGARDDAVEARLASGSSCAASNQPLGRGAACATAQPAALRVWESSTLQTGVRSCFFPEPVAKLARQREMRLAIVPDGRSRRRRSSCSSRRVRRSGRGSRGSSRQRRPAPRGRRRPGSAARACPRPRAPGRDPRSAARAIRPQPVDAEASRERGEPGPEGVVVPQRVQALVGRAKRLLEDVLRIGIAEPERLARSRRRTARSARRARARRPVAVAAAGDELGIGRSQKESNSTRVGMVTQWE